MRNVLRYVSLAVGIVLLLLVILAGTIWMITEMRWNRGYDIVTEPIDYRVDADLLEKGRHVATIRGCFECHGVNMEGKVFTDDPMLGRIVASNLTTGAGGIGTTYSDEDLVRSIRRGVKPNGKTVLFMPSHEYNVINKGDMTALIAYIRSMPPADNTLPVNKLRLGGRALYLITDDLHLFPAELIDPSLPMPTEEPQSVIEHGRYLSTTCMGCHGGTFSGGTIPGVPPFWPPATNLTPGGNLAHWSTADFITSMRTGVTPEGRQLPNEFMPWQMLGSMTDEELSALFAYLQTLEPLSEGNR